MKRLRVRRVVGGGDVFYAYKGELYPAYLSGGNAVRFILDKAREYCVGTGIDVGANQWPFPGAVPIHDTPGENAYRLDRFADARLDYVFSSHCLEHLDRWQDALRLWIRKLRTGGVLFLYLPHVSNELWKPGGPWVGDGHVWSPTWEVLCPFLEGEGMAILEFSRGRDHYWSFHIAARRER
jgi:SAM-dependent methyltransferase